MRRVLAVLVTLSCAGSVATAQTKTQQRFRILDNSFLVEEALNQEAGVFQNIFVVSRSRHGLWDGSFTQEWPVPSMRHQASVTLPFALANGRSAAGDLAFNYRFQLSEEGAGRPAIAPRLTVMMPTSDRTWDDGLVWQVNVPVSKQAGFVYLHANAGSTFERDATTPFFAASAILAVSPLFNVMFETVIESAPAAGGREISRTFSPGFRAGWNFGEKQLVAGAAVPVTRGARRDTAILGYLSYELPFRSRK